MREEEVMKLTAAATTPRVLAWLQHNQTAILLHSSSHTCNLVDTQGSILSLVTTPVGRGPFALVLPVTQFPAWPTGQPITVTPTTLAWADWLVDVEKMPLWEPRPRWDTILPHLPTIWPWLKQVVDRQPNPLSASQWHRLEMGGQQVIQAIRARDAAAINQAVAFLAGFGSGMTPAGDDWLMGVFYGLWVMGSDGSLLRQIAAQAGPRTTTLSAQFLSAAADGEAVQAWHDLVLAITTGEKIVVQQAAQAILAIGDSSGYCALSAFLIACQHFSR